MPSPLAWLRRRSNGDAAESPPLASEFSVPAPRQPSAASRLWNLLPPMPRMLLDPDRHVVNFRISYTTALVSAFAVVAVIALAFVIGRRMSTQTLPALAERTTEELRSGPAQPDVLDVGPEGAPLALVTQQRPTGRPSPATPQVRPGESSPQPARANWNDPKPPTTFIDVNQKRATNLNYVIVQSYPAQEKQMAQDACDLLNRRGVLCTVETGLHYAPTWYIVVGITGFDRVRSSPEYDAYVRKIEQIGLEFAGTSNFKKFEPRAFKWQEPKKAS
jgi:hypothetical protein